MGCGPKPPPPEPVSEEPSELEAKLQAQLQAAMEAEPPGSEPEPEEPQATNNADFSATLEFGDGRTVSGQVVRVERGDDWYAEEGWVDDSAQLVLTVERDGVQQDVPWKEVRELQVSYGERADIDCTYDSRFTPWMYMCTLRTDSPVTLADGERWEVSSRHKWRFTFADGKVEEFYAFKLPIRQQDTEVVDLDSTRVENYDLYGKLQTQALKDAKGALVRLEIQP